MAEKICPFLKKPCIEHGCKFYVHLLGANPQTGAQEDRWDCTLALLPILIIESSQQTRQAGAAIETFRNEMVKINEIALALPPPPLTDPGQRHPGLSHIGLRD